MNRPSRVSDRYRIVERLGTGRWSAVFEAWDKQNDQSVAIKLVRPKASLDAAQRIRHEADALRRIEHPNVLRVLDSGDDADVGPYLVTEHHRGRTIESLLVEVGRLPERWVAAVMVQLLAALDAVHRGGGAHGDITPSNCMCVDFASLDEVPRLCLLDFGASRWSSDGASDLPLTGTPTYMAPEQARGLPATPSSDIYAAGVLAYEMVAGVPPFRASTSTEVLWQQLHEAPRRPRDIVARDESISPPFEKAILRALAKDPARRFARASELASALTGASDARPGGVTTTRPPTIHEDVRYALLAQVRHDWIEGVLSRATDGVILVHQAMWRADALLVDPGSSDRSELDVGLSEAFDEHGQALLLLGDVGHGKTVNLLRLARRLADRAVDEDGSATIVPVVFTLSAWTTKDTELTAWMQRELGAKYLVPKREAARLFAEASVVPLLDGLDDVDPAARARCVDAINVYRRAHPRHGIVVTCRTHDYASLTVPLAMNVAVVLRELTTREIGRQLRAASQVDLLHALDENGVLQELAKTPVLLHVMRVAFRDSVGFRSALVERGEAVRELFEIYIASVCRSHGVRAEEVRPALERLACLMARTGRTLLLLEDAQPSWLSRARDQGLYAIVSRSVVAAIWSFSLVLAFGRSPLDNGGFQATVPFALRVAVATTLLLTIGFGGHALWRFRRPGRTKPRATVRRLGMFGAGALLGLAVGAIVYRFYPHVAAFVMGVESGAFGTALLVIGRKSQGDPDADIVTRENIGWSWRYIRLNKLVLLATICASTFMAARWFEGYMSALYNTVSVSLLGLVILGYRSRSSQSRFVSNIGIHRTARNAAAASVAAFVATAGLFGVSYGFGYGACVAITIATMMGLWLGGIDVIRHYILRVFLHLDGSLSLRPTVSLDRAVDLGLLRRVGNGYMFMHAMLLEHLAERVSARPDLK